jgi:hypothetical protein
LPVVVEAAVVVLVKDLVEVVLVDLELEQPQLEHIQYQHLSRLVLVDWVVLMALQLMEHHHILEHQ